MTGLVIASSGEDDGMMVNCVIGDDETSRVLWTLRGPDEPALLSLREPFIQEFSIIDHQFELMEENPEMM
jgi:hypothetical protein